jgi:hypothetical protein
MEIFAGIYDLPKLNKDDLNISIISNKIESVINVPCSPQSPQKKHWNG